MNTKNRHRLMVFLILIGTLVLSLPFLQHVNFLPQRSLLNKIPPFPDQSMQPPTAPVLDDSSKPKTVALMQQDPLAVASTTWVVQVGLFKHKTGALRLVNFLRSHGFRAFTKQSVEVTRVFIGPENKQSAAFAIANTVATELHINGIIKSYKPLML